MKRIGLCAAMVALGCVHMAARATTAISRFDTGLEGWTLEGPGQLEWVATGGDSGGYIRVTRTGPGEVYLVAPASFSGRCSEALGTTHLCLSAQVDRPVIRQLLAIVQVPPGTVFATLDVGCSGCWFPAARAGIAHGFSSYSGLKILVGVDPAMPVGEVTLFDNIEFRTAAANCDGSTTVPYLNANDFQCFLNAFAAGDPYANMDGSSGLPAITANDFQAFLNFYAQGSACP